MCSSYNSIKKYRLQNSVSIFFYFLIIKVRSTEHLLSGMVRLPQDLDVQNGTVYANTTLHRGDKFGPYPVRCTEDPQDKKTAWEVSTHSKYPPLLHSTRSISNLITQNGRKKNISHRASNFPSLALCEQYYVVKHFLLLFTHPSLCHSDEMFRRSQVVPLRLRKSNGVPPLTIRFPSEVEKIKAINAINAPTPMVLARLLYAIRHTTEYSVSPFTHPILAMAATLCDHVVIFRGEEPHRRIHQAKLSSYRMEIS